MCYGYFFVTAPFPTIFVPLKFKQPHYENSFSFWTDYSDVCIRFVFEL